MTPTLRAGVGRAVITPPVGIAHAGWGVQTHQRAEGVDLDLLATVLVLANGPVEAALVDVDFCVVGRDLADPIRQAVADLCASRSHTSGSRTPTRTRVRCWARAG